MDLVYLPSMRSLAFVLCLLTLVADTPSNPLAAQTPCSPTVTGALRVEVFESAIYQDRRTVRIWLPSDYEASENALRRYPVLYMFDGQTLFDQCTAFKNEQELKVDETLTRLISEKRVRALIVVGIDSSSRRPHEYRPYKDTVADPTAPEPIGKDLPAFLVNEVMAHVSARYRVTADPAETGIGGTSLGAVAALYVILSRSDRFGIGLIESATLPLGNGQLLRETAHIARGPDRIYIGVGTTELAVPGGDKFAAQLRTSLSVANLGFARMSETLAANLRAGVHQSPRGHAGCRTRRKPYIDILGSTPSARADCAVRHSIGRRDRLPITGGPPRLT